MEKELQYLVHCEEDDSHCVVFEADLIYNKKVRLECGSTVWFMYMNHGKEMPYRGTILEISDDGDMLYNLAQRFTSCLEKKMKIGENPQKSSDSNPKKSAAKTDKGKSKISEDKENAKAQKEARKKASKLEEDHIASLIKLGTKSLKDEVKSAKGSEEIAVTDEVKLLERFKLLTIEGQKCLDGLVRATIELEQLLADKSAKNFEKTDDYERESGIHKMSLKRNFMGEKSRKDFLHPMGEEYSSPKRLKHFQDSENDDFFDSENDLGDLLYEIDDDNEDYVSAKFGGNAKSKAMIDSKSSLRSKSEIKRNLGICEPSTSKSKIKVDSIDSGDLDETWTLKYTKKSEKTVELVKDSNIFVDKVALECAKKAATSPNVLARSLLELIFKKEALIKCTWNGGTVNCKGKTGKERSPALNFEGRQTLIAYVTAHAELLGWTFNHQSMMQSLRSKIGGFKETI